MYEKSIIAVRYLLGIQYFLGGLNWWIKILPFPSLSDGLNFWMKHKVVGAMVETGWMFYLAKIIEITTGLALIFNVFAPLMLVVSISVAASTFLLDAFIFGTIWAWISGTISFNYVVAGVLDMVFFGGAILIMQIYLMLSYLHYYRPMLTMRAEAKMP